jgi:hypothetical protein
MCLQLLIWLLCVMFKVYSCLYISVGVFNVFKVQLDSVFWNYVQRHLLKCVLQSYVYIFALLLCMSFHCSVCYLIVSYVYITCHVCFNVLYICFFLSVLCYCVVFFVLLFFVCSVCVLCTCILNTATGWKPNCS